MFNPHYSNFYWTELLFKLVTIPFLALVLLLFSSQLIRLQHLTPEPPPVELRYPSDIHPDIAFKIRPFNEW